MHLSITDKVTAEEKEELLTGLRAYNAQYLDLATFSGDIGVYVRDDNGVMLHHWLSCQCVEHFRQIGIHAGTFACGKDHHAHRTV